jgi:hypothetical protein
MNPLQKDQDPLEWQQKLTNNFGSAEGLLAILLQFPQRMKRIQNRKLDKA